MMLTEHRMWVNPPHKLVPTKWPSPPVWFNMTVLSQTGRGESFRPVGGSHFVRFGLFKLVCKKEKTKNKTAASFKD